MKVNHSTKMIGHIQKRFQKVSFPKYMESWVQEIALEHLQVKDMGKLRDSFEGQSYFDKLKRDLMAEYAFEKVLGFNFDWIKRRNKSYTRLFYEFEDKKIALVPFSSSKPPVIIAPIHQPIVLIFQKPDNTNFVSGIISKNRIEGHGFFDLSKSGKLSKTYFELIVRNKPK